VDRRAFIRISAGSIVAAGAALGVACDDDDKPKSGDGGPLAGEKPDAFFSDDFTTDGHGWGNDWLNVRYESAWWVAGGAAVSEVPVGIPKALAPGKGHTEYMAQPIVHSGAETATPIVEATVLRDGPVEAGLIACASFDESYALLLSEGKVLLCRYGITDRAVLAESKLEDTDDWVRLTLGVDGNAIAGMATTVGGKTASVEAKDDEPLAPGLVGTLVNPLSDKSGGRGKFKAFRAGAVEKPGDPVPRFTHRFAGAIVQDGAQYKARVTARTVLSGELYFEAASDESFENPITSSPGPPEGRLGAVHGWLEGLAPDTTYMWRPVAGAVGAGTPGPVASFKTPPKPGGAVKLIVASCTSGRVTEYPSFRTMKSFEPELLVHEGDWGYADLTSTARRGDHFQARWIRQLRAPDVAALLEQTPLLFWQDDHDYAADNGWSETCQEYAVTAFDELHANPSDDYFDIRWGDVHMWCLDCRLHATDPEGPDDDTKSRIGFEQKAWLKEGMTASDAPVKIVASGMVFRNKDPDDPGWQSVYTHERDELLEFFSTVEGTVAIVSGDSHGQRLIHHFEFGELWEINSSGTDFPNGGQDNYDPEHTEVNSTRSGFALVELDPAGPDRKLTIRSIASDDGSTIFEKTLPVA
jgi:hypothetical protein